MLELALSLLEEGVKQLDTYAPFPGMCLKVSLPSKLLTPSPFVNREFTGDDL